jgi:uncharacterized protein
MTNFIPVFPLGIVVYPGEQLNLHIFEPRYKQLINDCHQSGKPFGISTVIDNKPGELGTLVTLKEIVTRYGDGRMDITTSGIKIYRMLEMIKEVPDKLYAGAIVTYPHNQETTNRSLMDKILDSIKELHQLLKVNKEFKKPAELLTSYDVAHHVGLSLEEEYELLGLLNELQRQEYLKRHLVKVLKVVTEMEVLKERVQLNGHFKNLKGFDL